MGDVSPGTRRQLQFNSPTELAAEVDRLVAAQRAGRLAAAGGWTPAQIFEHLAKFMEFTYDGFPFQVGWHIRVISKLAKWIAWKPFVRFVFRPGHKLQGSELVLMPAADADFDATALRLRAVVGRILGGEPMLASSPFEGSLSHDQWIFVHLRHAELHLSFLHVDEGPEIAPYN